MAKWVIRLFVLAVLGMGGWAGWQYLKPKQTVEIRSTPVTRGPLSLSVTATGRLAPTIQVLVGCEVSGTVGEILVEHNDKVKKGQIIARLRPEMLRAENEQAKAEFARAEATLKQLEVQEAEAKRRLERVQKLQDQGAAGKEEKQSLEATWKAACASSEAGKAAVRGAQNAVDLTNYRLGKTEIASPIDGIVLDRRVDVGQTVAATLMTPELFVLAEDLSRMDLLADVSEADIGYICRGQRAIFTVNAYRDREFKGTVRQIRNQPHNVGNVVTYTVVIEVANNDLLLRPGMPADITLEVVRVENTAKIANAALRFRPPMAPDDVRKVLDGLQWPPAPAPIPVAGSPTAPSKPSAAAEASAATKKADEVGIVPPPIEPVKATLWQSVAGTWKPVPVWTAYTDNRETLLFAGPGVTDGASFVTEVIVSGGGGPSQFEQAILMTRPENRRL
jgi:HlyD family secretion protein